MANFDQIKVLSEAKQDFLEGFPIANSHLGMMVYGNVSEESLVLNDNTFWVSKNKYNRHSRDFYKNYKRVQNLLIDNNNVVEANKEAKKLLPKSSDNSFYTTAGFLKIKYNTSRNSTNYERILNLSEGYVSVNYDLEDNHIERTYFASKVDDLIAINIESNKDIEIEVSLGIKNNLKKIKNIKNTNRQYMHVKVLNIDLYSNIIVNAKSVVYKDNLFILKGNSITIYYISSTTNYKTNSKSYLNKLYNNIKSKEYSNIFKEAKEDYKSLYNKQSFHTNLDILDNYYNLSRYLTISTSRSNYPINLCGLWSEEYKQKNSSLYNLDINFELNYCNVLESNLIDCYKPLLQYIKKLNKNGKRIAKSLYHSKGSVTHSKSNYYANCSMFGSHLNESLWSLGQIELCSFIFKYFFFTRDLQFLKKNYKILLSNAQFLMDILVKDKHGKYVVAPSISPENKFFEEEIILTKKNTSNLYEEENSEGIKTVKNVECAVAAGTTFDDQLIYEFFYNLIVVNRILGHDEDENKTYLEILLNLHHVQIYQNKVLEYHEDYELVDKSTPYMSHLYQLINKSINPANVVKEASYNTVREKLENSADDRGFSSAYIALLLSHLSKSDLVYNQILKYNKNFSSSTYLNKGLGFEIDANMCIARTIRDMFIIDSNNRILLLDTIPNNLNTYTLKGFPIYNNMIIDLYKANDMFLLIVESFDKTDLQITYKNKDYFLKIKSGKNNFDLNEILNQEIVKKM